MGRQKKPTYLRAVEGSLDGKYGRGRGAKAANEPIPLGNLSANNPPPHFCDVRKEIWSTALRSAPNGLLRRLDSQCLEDWCESVYISRQAIEKFSASAMLIKTPNGAVVQSPYLGIINTQAKLRKSLAAEMGFTPASRTRISLEDDTESEDPAERFFR